MVKKLTLLAMAVAAIGAFAAPAMANAAGLTMPAGTLVPVGTEITLTANGTLFTETSLGTLECENVMIGGTVTKNNGSEFEGEGNATGNTTSGCSVEGELPVTITNPKAEILKSTTAGHGTVSLSFTADIERPTGTVTCSFKTPAATPGGFTYTVGNSTVTLGSTKLESALCGEAFISSTTNGVSLETTPANGGGAVILD